jgi:hypothetical protein
MPIQPSGQSRAAAPASQRASMEARGSILATAGCTAGDRPVLQWSKYCLIYAVYFAIIFSSHLSAIESLDTPCLPGLPYM